MNVSFRQLRLFLALADTGSVTGAARALHVTQPTASMQLRQVAEAVGLPLYDVVARRVRLTPAGERLARTARSMVAEWSAFGQEVAALKGLERGELRLGIVSTAKYFIPRMLGEYCRRHPGVAVSLEVLNRDGVIARLRENRDDLYVMSRPPPDVDAESRIFLANPLVAIAPASHRLARRRRLSLRDLAQEPFLLREKGSGTRLAVDEHFARARFRPKVRLELASNEAIKVAVAGDLGIAILSRHALDEPLRPKGIAILDVAGLPIESRWHLVRRKGRHLSPAAAEFERALAEGLPPVRARTAR